MVEKIKNIFELANSEEAKEALAGISGVRSTDQQLQAGSFSKEIIERAKLLGIDPSFLDRVSKETNTAVVSVGGEQIKQVKEKDEKEIKEKIKSAMAVLTTIASAAYGSPATGNNTYNPFQDKDKDKTPGHFS